MTNLLSIVCADKSRHNHGIFHHPTKVNIVFTALINRNTDTKEWQKIPWHDPDFSRRMLAEHLAQSHDLASRRLTIIDQQVEWIDRKILKGQPSRILDLGCGPGFYTSRFTARGHICKGLDFSPASIAYAREHDSESEYVPGSILDLDYGQEYDLITLIYGELNAFSPEDAERILNKAYAALKPAGKLLLEVHPAETIYRIGHQTPSWHTAEKGLFSDKPYLCLVESKYEGDHSVTFHYVYEANSGEMRSYVNMLQSYTDDEYRYLLSAFKQVMFYPSLTGSPESANLFVIVAGK